MNSELAGLNPIELEFGKAVRFPSDKIVDVAVVKRVPQYFSSTERSCNLQCSLLNSLDAIDVNCPLSASIIVPMTG